MNRAERRHRKARTRARFRKIVQACWGYNGQPDRDGWVDYWVVKFAETRKPCSCWGCGNRRRWEGPPVQELRRADPS